MRVLTFLTFVLAIAFMAVLDIVLFMEDILYGATIISPLIE